MFDISVNEALIWECYRPLIWRKTLVENGLMKPIMRGNISTRSA